jgi:hypothetical protein
MYNTVLSLFVRADRLGILQWITSLADPGLATRVLQPFNALENQI